MTTTTLDRVEEGIRQAWRPPRRLSLPNWADHHFVLPEGDANAGRWRTRAYQRGILDAAADPLIERVSVMKSSRVGWSRIVLIVLGSHIENDPCSMLGVQPTVEDARNYSKEDVAPMLSDVRALRDLVVEPRSKDGDNTILHKRFTNGAVLSLVGANSPRGFRRTSRRVVVFEEIDGYPQSAGAEGDPYNLGVRRTESYWNRKILTGSSPTIEGYSRIAKLFEEGDQRRRYLPCPRCVAFQVLKFKNMKWPEGHPEQAYFVCEANECQIEHRYLREMDEAGEWRAEKPEHFTEFNRHASFHIWSAYSYSPNATWGHVASEFVAAVRGGAVTLKTWVNTWEGETWKDKGEAPDWQRLFDRRERYPIGRCPSGVLFLTAGVDVQRTRLKLEVVGWGRQKESWSIDAWTIPGDTADLVKGPWPQLDAVLNRMFPHEYGGELPISLLAVDSGDQTQTVYNWAKKYPMNRVIAVKGMPSGYALISPPRPVEVSSRGRKLKRGYRVWDVGGDVAKGELYGWLGLQLPTQAGAPYPPGYCHFPEYGDWFFKELTAERWEPVKNRRGYVRMEFVKLPNRDNDHLDARVYARAAAAVVGLDRFTEGDWLAMEAAVGKPPAAEPDYEGDEIPEGAEVVC